MGALSEIQATIAAQNQAVAAQANAPPPVEAPKPEAQAAEEAKRAAQVDQQPTTEDKKAESKAKRDALRALADASTQKFTEAQELRKSREKADGEIASMRAEMEKLAKDAAEARAELGRAKEKPLDWIQGQGVKLRALAEAVAKGDTPDAKVEALQKSLVELEERNTQKIAALQEQYQKALKETAEKEAKAAMEARNAQARRDFLDAWEGGRGEWDYLREATGGDTQRLIEEFMVTYNDVKANPETGPFVDEYSNKELLAATNARIRRRAEESAQLLARLSGGAANTNATTVSVKPSLESKPTLTTATAVEPGALPVDFKKLAPKDQKKAMAEMYRSLRKSG